MRLPPDPRLTLLAHQIADEYHLDGAVVCAIVEQESDWNPGATRYEPAFYSRYILPLNIPAEEGRQRATSWGLMQIMGETAVENGYPGPIPALLDPATGLKWGCIHFAKVLGRSSGDVYSALLHWNGGANQSYPGQVIARIDKYVTPINLEGMEA